MPPEETATFALKIDGDAEPAKEAAEALEKFRAAIEKSQEAIAGYRKSMQLLKGSSAEVKDAKDKLRAAIAAEQAQITKHNLGILKLGGSYDKLNKAHKKSNDAFAVGKKIIQGSNSPLKEVSEKFSGLKELLGGITSGSALAAAGMAILVVAVAAATVAVAAGLVKFTEWVASSADLNRNLQLTREAFSGSESNATAWGHQIDWARLKVAQTTEQLNELTKETEKTFRNTRISGQGMVDIWQAVALARGAGREDTGQKLMAIIDRAKSFGRGGIQGGGPLGGLDELAGTGLTRMKVAVQLAKDLHISVGKADQALYMGYVQSSALAEALREASEAQFGSLNERKLRSLSSLWATLQDNVLAWTEDLDKADGPLEPLLKDLQSLVSLTGLQTESGQGLKKSVEEYAKAASRAFHEHLPEIKATIMGVIALTEGAIKLGAAFVQFASSGPGLILLKGALIGMVAVAGVLVAGLALVGGAFAAVFYLAKTVGRALGDLFYFIANFDLVGAGVSVVQGLIQGFSKGFASGWDYIKKSVSELGSKIKKEFFSVLELGSPSKLTRKYGKWTGQGYASGLEDSGDEVAKATSKMVATPEEVSGGPAGGAGGGYTGGASPTVT